MVVCVFVVGKTVKDQPVNFAVVISVKISRTANEHRETNVNVAEVAFLYFYTDFYTHLSPVLVLPRVESFIITAVMA